MIFKAPSLIGAEGSASENVSTCVDGPELSETTASTSSVKCILNLSGTRPIVGIVERAISVPSDEAISNT
jgi:hypothetical protein